jgi:hypothetical protein
VEGCVGRELKKSHHSTNLMLVARRSIYIYNYAMADAELDIHSGSKADQASETIPAAEDSINVQGLESNYSLLLRAWWILLILFWVIGVAVAYKDAVLGRNLSLIGLVMSIVLLLLRQRYIKNLFPAFANANHYSYEKTGQVNNLNGIIFSVGRARRISQVVTGIYRGLNLLLFRYTYVTGIGRYSRRYRRAVLVANFHTATPAFILRSHKMLQALRSQGESLRARGYTEKINLDERLNQRFQIYTTPNNQARVLAILATDVLERLVAIDRFEIEMTQNGSLYIYSPDSIKGKASLLTMYEIVNVISSKMETMQHIR